MILLTHNRPVWLRQAIMSVLDGQFQDFELIVSNNGQPEHTRNLAAEIGDARVRWIESRTRDGRENFVAALPLARGRYIATLHDDDWWHPRMLATIIPPLRMDPAIVVSFAEPWQVDAEGEVDLEATTLLSAASRRATLHEGVHRPFYELAVWGTVPILACAFRRDSVAPESFPADVGAAYDFWAGHLMARGGGTAYFTRERLVYCREHADSDFSLRREANLLGAVRCAERMVTDPCYVEYRDQLTWRLAEWHKAIGANFLRRGIRAAARAHLRAAFAVQPTARLVAAWAASAILPRSLLARL